MKSAFDNPAIGSEKEGERAVKTSMGTASIERYSRGPGGRHGGPDAGFDVFHPNGVHIGYLRQVYKSDTHGCYVAGLAEPQFIAESTAGDSLVFVQAEPIVKLVEALCKNAGRNPR